MTTLRQALPLLFPEAAFSTPSLVFTGDPSLLAAFAREAEALGCSVAGEGEAAFGWVDTTDRKPLPPSASKRGPGVRRWSPTPPDRGTRYQIAEPHTTRGPRGGTGPKPSSQAPEEKAPEALPAPPKARHDELGISPSDLAALRRWAAADGLALSPADEEEIARQARILAQRDGRALQVGHLSAAYGPWRAGKQKAPEEPAAPVAPEGMTGDDVAALLASQHFNRAAGRTAEDLKERWVNSERFVLMEIPADLPAAATPVQPGARTASTGPIVVDLNKTGMGRHGGAFGAPADVLILDGKHRHAEALAAGRKTVKAFVGEKAVPLVERAIRERREKADAVSAAVRAFAANADGSTLRALRAVLPESEVERVRQARRALTAGAPVPPEVLADYPGLGGEAAPAGEAVEAAVEPAEAPAYEWVKLSAKGAQIPTKTRSGRPLQLQVFKRTVSRFEGRESVVVDSHGLAADGANRNLRLMTWLRDLYDGYRHTAGADPDAHPPDSFRDGVEIDAAMAAWMGIKAGPSLSEVPLASLMKPRRPV